MHTRADRHLDLQKQEVNLTENGIECEKTAKERLEPLLCFMAVPTAGGEIAAFGGMGEPVFTGGNAAARRRGQKGARAPYGALAPS